MSCVLVSRKEWWSNVGRRREYIGLSLALLGSGANARSEQMMMLRHLRHSRLSSFLRAESQNCANNGQRIPGGYKFQRKMLGLYRYF